MFHDTPITSKTLVFFDLLCSWRCRVHSCLQRFPFEVHQTKLHWDNFILNLATAKCLPTETLRRWCFQTAFKLCVSTSRSDWKGQVLFRWIVSTCQPWHFGSIECIYLQCSCARISLTSLFFKNHLTKWVKHHWNRYWVWEKDNLGHVWGP